MLDSPGYVAIIVAALLTYGLRMGGLSLGRLIPTRGPAGALLEQLPGIVLVSLVVPDVLELGVPGLAGIVAATIGWHASRGNVLVAIAAGAAMVAMWRSV